jgi:prophage regulatory protein
MDRIMRQSEVLYLTGMCRSSLDRAEKSNNFPKRKKLGPKSIGWLQSEVQAWIEGRNEPEKREQTPEKQEGAPV